MKNYLKITLVSALLAALSLPLLAQSIERGTPIKITIMGVPVEEKQKVDALYPVSATGTVNLPLIGRMRAAGLRPETLAIAIQNAYKSAEIYTNPTIQVIATGEGDRVREQRVTVGGSVRRPGPIPFNKDMTLYQAVQAAGGETEFGAVNRLKLFRNGKVKTYDLGKAEVKRIKLRSNDTIEVPAKNLIGR